MTALSTQGHNQGNVDDSAADGAEIDIFESAWTSNTTKSVVHYDGYGADHMAYTVPYNTPNIHSGYHIFGLHWTSTTMDVYYDGVKVSSTNASKPFPISTDPNNGNVLVPQVPEWLWLSVGASFGDGDFQSQPVGILSDALVDYVRVWKEDTTTPPPTVNDTIFRIVNKQTGKWIKTNGDADDSTIVQADVSQFGDWTQWKQIDTDNGYFYFENSGNGKYFRPETSSDGSLLKLKPNTSTGAWTQWKQVDTGDGYFYLVNRQTGKYLKPDSSNNNANILSKKLKGNKNWFKWKFEYDQ